jgi:hypothetical protein
MAPALMLLALVAAHALCDYPLQGPFLSEAKSRFKPVVGFPWYQAMAAHSIIHGAAVAMITGVWALGVAEVVAHFVIDDAKCAGRISVNEDQALHLGFKILWVLIAWSITS